MGLSAGKGPWNLKLNDPQNGWLTQKFIPVPRWEDRKKNLYSKETFNF